MIDTARILDREEAAIRKRSLLFLLVGAAIMYWCTPSCRKNNGNGEAVWGGFSGDCNTYKYLVCGERRLSTDSLNADAMQCRKVPTVTFFWV